MYSVARAPFGMIKNLFSRATTIEAVFLLVIGIFTEIALYSLIGTSKLDPTVSAILGATVGASIGVCGAVWAAIWVIRQRDIREREAEEFKNQQEKLREVTRCLVPLIGLETSLEDLMQFLSDPKSKPVLGHGLEGQEKGAYIRLVLRNADDVDQTPDPSWIVGWDTIAAVKNAKIKVRTMNEGRIEAWLETQILYEICDAVHGKVKAAVNALLIARPAVDF